MDTLTRWDGINLLNDDGKTWQQPGPAILNVWLTSMLECAVAVIIPMSFNEWYGTSDYGTTQNSSTGSLNVNVGAKILYKAVQRDKSLIPQAVNLSAGKSQQETVLAVLEDTWETLSKRYGNSVSNWKAPAMALTFRANDFFGVSQAAAKETRYQAEYQNRGTENDMIISSPTTSNRPMFTWDVVAPGQNGFVAPDGTVDKRYGDQLKIYENFGRKSL